MPKTDGPTGSDFPVGGIILWSGAVADIPTGFAICDGNNGTPNLTDRFVIHADNDSGGTRDVGDTGGASTHTHAAGTYTGPSHTHPQNGSGPVAQYISGGAGLQATSLSGGSYEAYQTGGANSRYVPTTGVSASGNSAVTGTSASGDNIPKFYALAYIMKT